MADVNDLIDAIADKNFNAAEESFNDLLKVKMADALEAEKVNVASSMIGGDEEEELSDEDQELLDSIDEDDIDEYDDEDS